MATDREERIRQLAHEIWEREGHPHGRDAEHWRLATEAFEAERARASRGDTGEPNEVGREALQDQALRTPAVASSNGAAANQPVTSLPATRRKRRTKAEMEAARTAEAAAPQARRGRKSQGDAAPQVAETAPAATKRRRGSKAETTGEAAPAPAADAALRHPRKPRQGATLSEAEPGPVAVESGSAAGAVPDPSADGLPNEAAGAMPDPGAERPSVAGLETSLGSAPDAHRSSDKGR